jgi:hypothetical protein
MAQGLGSAKEPKFTHDVFGGKFYNAIDYSGPRSYVQGGDALDPRYFAFPNSIITLIGSADHTNTYWILPRPIQNGSTAWQAVWMVTATGVEVGAGVNLSTYTVRLSAIGI